MPSSHCGTQAVPVSASSMGLGTTSKCVYIDKLVGMGVFDPIGNQVGKIHGVVATFRAGGTGSVIGFVMEMGPRKRVFLPLVRVASIEAGSVTTTDPLNVRSFTQRPIETLVLAELFDRAVTSDDGPGEVGTLDVAVERRRPKDWAISKLHVQRQHIVTLRFTRSGETSNVRVSEVSGLLEVDANQATTSLIVQTEDIRPADLVGYLRDLPIERRMATAQQLSDARLVDVLEEFGGDDRVVIASGLEVNCAANILNVIQPDDVADLVSELPEAQAQTLLSLIEPEETKDVRHLLSYTGSTAGPPMTTDPVIFGSDATVTQILASARCEDLPAPLVTVAFITRPPEKTPTGPYLGMVHIRRVLREPPRTFLGTILDSNIEVVSPQVHIVTVTRLLVTYSLTVLPIVDEDSRLLGTVSVDDLLDEFLPEDWRDYNDEVADHVMVRSIDG